MNETERNLNETQSLFKRYIMALDETFRNIPDQAFTIIWIITISSILLFYVILVFTNKRTNKLKIALETLLKYVVSFICIFLMPFLAEFKGLAFIQFLISITKISLKLLFEILVDMVINGEYEAT